MNYSIIRYILCRVLEFQAWFLALPCAVALIYKEKEGWAYGVVLVGCLLLGALGKMKKPFSCTKPERALSASSSDIFV